jgi:hypothetical protein
MVIKPKCEETDEPENYIHMTRAVTNIFLTKTEESNAMM